MSDDTERRAQARVGNVLDEKWTLEKLLGIGGMGSVYAARHRNGARAAIKVLHANLGRHEDVRERFLREGYAANRVEHPGVVKVLDDDEIADGPDAGTAYLVMELLEGESLEDRFERGPLLGEHELLVIAEAVLDVLEAAHAHGVVHRDLKPENLFLLKDEEHESGVAVRVKVLDFGLARLLEAHVGTINGVAVGTPSFMSPEQASGRRDAIDGRTDLFSLAATGFRLVTGRRIHDGATPVELVTKMSSLPAPPIQSIAPHVSAAFARVIDKALAFERDDRYPDAAAMRADVQRALRELAPATSADAPLDAAPTIVSPPVFDEALTVVKEGPLLAVKQPEPTVELSASDFETIAAPRALVVAPPPPIPEKPAPPPAPAPAPAPVPPVAIREPPSRRADLAPITPTPAASPAPPPPRQRGSFLLVITALAIGAIGGKLALHALPPEEPATMPSSAAAATASETPEPPPSIDATAGDADVLSSAMPAGEVVTNAAWPDAAPDELATPIGNRSDGGAAYELAMLSGVQDAEATDALTDAPLEDASAPDDASLQADAETSVDAGLRAARAVPPGAAPAASTAATRPRPPPRPEPTHPVPKAPDPPKKRAPR